MRETVLASSESSRDAHRELYRFAEDAYIVVSGSLLDTITAFNGDSDRLHISSDWSDAVRLAVWKTDPGIGDALFLLRNMGISSEELLPYRRAEVSDLFPWLYYGKRFDVLRKICFAAKTNAERHVRNREMRVHCHLSSADTNRIVASSL
jgi:hypothetical protein